MKQNIIKILLIEATDKERNEFHESFKDNQALITDGRTVEDVMDLLDDNPSSFDIIVSVNNLPGKMSGIDLCRIIKAKKKLIPFVLLVKKNNINIAKDAVEGGVNDYIIKDDDKNHLKLIPIVIPEVIKRYNNHIKHKSVVKDLNTNKKELQLTVERLRESNKKILEQQKSVIEEERLKVLLQMAGATASEFDGPLMNLLDDIQMLTNMRDKNLFKQEPFSNIFKTSNVIMDLLKKMNKIRWVEQMPYVENTYFTESNIYLKILLIDSSDDDFENITSISQNIKKISITRVLNIKDALEEISTGSFNIIFMEHLLPDGNSFNFLQNLKKNNIEIPVVVITGHGDEILASLVIQAGAYDYLTKHSLSERSVFRSINNAMEKFRLKTEIKTLKQAMGKMGQMASIDDLTGLYNRRFFAQALNRETARSIRYNIELVLCIFDLDYFKKVNDTYGHPAGDLVISQVSKMLKKTIRLSDLACRYGGEEFAVIFPNTEPEKIYTVCERFRDMVKNYIFEYKNIEFNVTVSIGIAALSWLNNKTGDALIDIADKALYQAKNTGRDKTIMFSG